MAHGPPLLPLNEMNEMWKRKNSLSPSLSLSQATTIWRAPVAALDRMPDAIFAARALISGADAAAEAATAPTDRVAPVATGGGREERGERGGGWLAGRGAASKKGVGVSARARARARASGPASLSLSPLALPLSYLTPPRAAIPRSQAWTKPKGVGLGPGGVESGMSPAGERVVGGRGGKSGGREQGGRQAGPQALARLPSLILPCRSRRERQ